MAWRPAAVGASSPEEAAFQQQSYAMPKLSASSPTSPRSVPPPNGTYAPTSAQSASTPSTPRDEPLSPTHPSLHNETGGRSRGYAKKLEVTDQGIVDVESKVALKVQRAWRRGRFKKALHEQAHRAQVMKELLASERVYVDSLTLVQEAVIKRSRSAMLSHVERQALFGFLEPLIVWHQGFYIRLQDCQSNRSDLETPEHAQCREVRSLVRDRLQNMYKIYAIQYANLFNLQVDLMQRNPYFASFIKTVEADKLKNTLQSFYILPVQRPPRYQLLLKELLKHTSQRHPDYRFLLDTLAVVKQVCDCMNTEMKAVPSMIVQPMTIQSEATPATAAAAAAKSANALREQLRASQMSAPFSIQGNKPIVSPFLEPLPLPSSSSSVSSSTSKFPSSRSSPNNSNPPSPLSSPRAPQPQTNSWGSAVVPHSPRSENKGSSALNLTRATNAHPSAHISPPTSPRASAAPSSQTPNAPPNNNATAPSTMTNFPATMSPSVSSPPLTQLPVTVLPKKKRNARLKTAIIKPIGSSLPSTSADPVTASESVTSITGEEEFYTAEDEQGSLSDSEEELPRPEPQPHPVEQSTSQLPASGISPRASPVPKLGQGKSLLSEAISNAPAFTSSNNTTTSTRAPVVSPRSVPSPSTPSPAPVSPRSAKPPQAQSQSQAQPAQRSLLSEAISAAPPRFASPTRPSVTPPPVLTVPSRTKSPLRPNILSALPPPVMPPSVVSPPPSAPPLSSAPASIWASASPPSSPRSETSPLRSRPSVSPVSSSPPSSPSSPLAVRPISPNPRDSVMARDALLDQMRQLRAKYAARPLSPAMRNRAEKPVSPRSSGDPASSQPSSPRSSESPQRSSNGNKSPRVLSRLRLSCLRNQPSRPLPGANISPSRTSEDKAQRPLPAVPLSPRRRSSPKPMPSPQRRPLPEPQAQSSRPVEGKGGSGPRALPRRPEASPNPAASPAPLSPRLLPTPPPSSAQTPPSGQPPLSPRALPAPRPVSPQRTGVPTSSIAAFAQLKKKAPGRGSRGGE